MMNGGPRGQGRSKDPVERVIDLFVHTPIGLAVMAWKRVPEFVGAMPDMVGQALAKGCSQLAGAETAISEEVRKARMIGQVAVTFGGRQLRKEVDARLADVVKTAGGVASFLSGTTAPGAPNGAAAPKPRPASDPLASEAPATPTAATGPPASEAPATPTAARGPATKAPAGKAPAGKAPASHAPAAKAARPRKAAAPKAAVASAADLPIREYDGLSASQVVSRLTGLTPDELRAVRVYEEGSRARRTILLAIDRLLG